MRLLFALSRGLLGLLSLSAVKADEVVSLIETLNRGEEQARFVAACRLQKFGPKAEAAVPPLVEAMKSGGVSLRLAAKDALIRIGPTAVPSLVQVLNDHDLNVEVRSQAAYAIGHIGGHNALAPLIMAFNDEHGALRASATIALGRDRRPAPLRWSAGSMSDCQSPLHLPEIGSVRM